MTAAEGVAAVLVLGMTIYAWSGMADYGAGLWDLLAGGRERGRRPRELIDAAVTPIWEANHVWLVYLLIVTWTGFGIAFASFMTTLYIPLSLAALGIVLRGASFALRKDAAKEGRRHLAGWLFGLGSLLTPFFLGAAIGAVAAGRVPVGNAAGNQVTSWWNPFAVTVGGLAIVVGAFLAAVYLIAEAQRRGVTDLKGYFRVRAIAAAAVGLLLGGLALFTLRTEQRQMYDRVVHRSVALIVLGTLALAVTFVLALRGRVRGIRVVAALGVAALVWSWAVAQYPYLLPFDLTIAQGAGADVTLRWLLVWALVAMLVVLPLLALLYVLDQRADLGEEDGQRGPGSRGRHRGTEPFTRSG
jgi:cytochrome bd ubiquinol oxidase subunit II